MAYITKINNYDIPCFNYTTDEIVSNDVSSNLINIIYPVGSVYLSADNTNPGLKFSGTTWVQIGTKLAVRENIVGNGKGLAITDGTRTGVLQGTVSALNGMYQAWTGVGNNIGTSIGNWKGSSIGDQYKTIGVPTKAQLGSNLENSGLIVDTETIYSWKRTA